VAGTAVAEAEVVQRLMVLSFVVGMVVVPTLARADGPATARGADDDVPSLYSAEVRAGYGVAMGGGAGRASVRGSPLVLAARVAIAIREEPRLSGYGGLIVETLDRTGVGGEGGVVLHPTARTRLRGGAVAMVAPYRLYGGVLGGGRCLRGAPRVCLDLDASVFVAGSDLPSGGAAMQVVLGLGIGFDAN
jgi:hypothetical protein